MNMMTFITLTIVLLVIISIVPPIESSLNKAIDSDAKIQSDKIVSAINVLSSSPQNAQIKISLPAGECRVVAQNGVLNYTVKKTSRAPVSVIRKNMASKDVSFDKECPSAFVLSNINGKIGVI